MSFAFEVDPADVRNEKVDDNNSIDVILKVKRLWDVSVVTYPAYPAASASFRAFEPVEDTSGHGELWIGNYVVNDIPQQNAVSSAFPSHHSISCRLATITDAQRRSGDLADPKKLFIEFALWNLVIDLLFDRMNRKNTFV
jgi:hypothetical protein